MTWWRAHDEAVDDPKLQMLPPHLFKAWFNLCCLASANNGTLPPFHVVSFKLRMSESETKIVLNELQSRGLNDDVDGELEPHNWRKRQYKSDNSTGRVRQFRERQRNVSETPPETENRIQRQKQKERKKSICAVADATRTADDVFFDEF